MACSICSANSRSLVGSLFIGISPVGTEKAGENVPPARMVALIVLVRAMKSFGLEGDVQTAQYSAYQGNQFVQALYVAVSEIGGQVHCLNRPEELDKTFLVHGLQPLLAINPVGEADLTIVSEH
jgi:hypothetical protein